MTWDNFVQWTQSINLSIANIAMNVVLWAIAVYAIVWLIKELYFWVKYHLMGLLEQRKWNQFRRR